MLAKNIQLILIQYKSINSYVEPINYITNELKLKSILQILFSKSFAKLSNFLMVSVDIVYIIVKRLTLWQ